MKIVLFDGMNLIHRARSGFMKGEDALLALYNNRFLEAIQWLKILGEGKKTRDEYFYDKVRKDVA